MANLNTGGEQKKGKPKKQNLRVDFTPMVDMNMLLITFFMFCTTLSKPQTMDIVLPTKDNQDLTEEQKNKVKESLAITVILGENDIIYCYEGKPDYTNYASVKELNYAGTGDASLRQLLLGSNEKLVKKITELKMERYRNKINEEQFKTQSDEAKKELGEDAPVVIIKPTDASSYRNLVDVLDEMQICSINKYAVVEMGDADNFLVQNYKEKGALSAQAPKQ